MLSATLIISSTLAAPVDRNILEKARRLQEKLAAFEHHPADLATFGGGYLGGPVVNEPDRPGQAASWPFFVAEGLVTGAKYTAAGIETGGDFISGGFLQASSNPASNTINRYNDLGTDTVHDFANLAQGGTINPFAATDDETKQDGADDTGGDERRHLEAQVEKPAFGEALGNVGDSFNNDAANLLNQINPFAPEPAHDRARITVLAQSDGCGNTHDDSSLIRPFFVDSRTDPSTFHWCPLSGCDEALFLGGDTLHYDFGMVKLRGCPLHEAYTIPYLRLMKVLLGSFNTLYLGWGACDQAETNCAVGADVTMKPGDCKTLVHPLKPEQKYDVCFIGTL